MIMFEELELMLPEEGFDGPMQMAIDETLLREVSSPMLRIYRWVAPCITFGYFQRLSEVRLSVPDLPAVRRWTGGGIVEHGKDLTFSLMIPRSDRCATMPPAHFYRELHGLLAVALSRCVPSVVRLAEKGDLRAGEACFSAPAADDLIMAGEKILGGAQRRSAGALLYQGSLQGVNGFFALSDPGDLASALSSHVVRRPLQSALKQGALKLAENRYRRSDWNGRR